MLRVGESRSYLPRGKEISIRRESEGRESDLRSVHHATPRLHHHFEIEPSPASSLNRLKISPPITLLGGTVQLPLSSISVNSSARKLNTRSLANFARFSGTSEHQQTRWEGSPHSFINFATAISFFFFFNFYLPL